MFKQLKRGFSRLQKLMLTLAKKLIARGELVRYMFARVCVWRV